MAVTQQLARLSPTLFELCRRDTVTLMRLLSFNLVGDDRHLDLDARTAGMVILVALTLLNQSMTRKPEAESNLATLQDGQPCP